MFVNKNKFQVIWTYVGNLFYLRRFKICSYFSSRTLQCRATCNIVYLNQLFSIFYTITFWVFTLFLHKHLSPYTSNVQVSIVLIFKTVIINKYEYTHILGKLIIPMFRSISCQWFQKRKKTWSAFYMIWNSEVMILIHISKIRY